MSRETVDFEAAAVVTTFEAAGNELCAPVADCVLDAGVEVKADVAAGSESYCVIDWLLVESLTESLLRLSNILPDDAFGFMPLLPTPKLLDDDCDGFLCWRESGIPEVW